MNKPVIAALVAAIAFSALPALASPVSASANDQPVVVSGVSAGTQIAQSSDNQNDNGSSAPQSNDEDK